MEEHSNIDFVYFTTYTEIPEFEGTITESGCDNWVSSSWEKTNYVC